MSRAKLQIATGKYTGDAGAAKPVTVGFKPDLILVKRGDATAPTTIKMPGDLTHNISTELYLQSAALTTAILHPTETGFLVGISGFVNTASAVYYWLAIKAPKSFMFGGGYQGSGAIASITDAQMLFTPDFLWTMCTTHAVGFATFKQGNAADDGARFSGLAAGASLVTAMTPGGFDLSASADVNSASYRYLYTAFKHHPDCITSGEYIGTGEGMDVALPFRPDALIVRNIDAAVGGIIYTSGMQTDGVGAAKMGAATTLGGITITDAGFSVTGLTELSGLGNRHKYFAFKAGSFSERLARVAA